VTSIATIAARLREIVDLYGRLDAHALYGPEATRGDIPGGHAVVELADSASPETWANKLDGAERAASAGRRAWPVIDDDEQGTVLWTLRYWSETYREELGMAVDDDAWKPTVVSEARFLAMKETLDHIWETEAHLDDLGEDLQACVTRLENVLRAGERPDRTRITCPDCTDGRGMIRQWGDGDESTDRWKCPGCKHKFTDEDLPTAYARQMRSQGTEKWISVTDALSVLRSQGEREDTAREWLKTDDVDLREVGNRREVWWPDMWRLHIQSRVRRAVSAANRAALAARKEACKTEHGEDCWEARRGCSAEDAA
jgi:hypothetical protein